MATRLADVIDIPLHAGANDYVLRLTDSVGEDGAKQALDAYVVTDELVDAFDAALGLVGEALRADQSKGAFLTGSFGSGKSHFMAVLHALLRHDPDARAKAELMPVVDRHDADLAGKQILPLAFHMLDSESFEQAIFSGYLRQIQQMHPGVRLPALHRTDALLADAAALRERMGDDAFFAGLNGDVDDDPWAQVSEVGTWDADAYAAAVAAAPRTGNRQQLVGDLVAAYFGAFTGGSDWIGLEDGLAVIAEHAKSLGYDAVVLFLDELVLWLAFRVQERDWFGREVQKLTKLVESATGRRAIPLVSIIARQLDLQKWFADSGADGAEQESVEQGFRYQEGRFGKIRLGDDNLPYVASKRLLAPKDEHASAVLAEAFEQLDRSPQVWSVLLDGINTDDDHRGSDEAAFRLTYPFSPALISTLKSLASVMQRERTALKVMQQLLVERRDTLTVADVIPVGDAYDLIITGAQGVVNDTGRANQFKAAHRLFKEKIQPMLLSQHNLTAAALDDPGAETRAYRNDERLAKTSLLAAVAPDVPALKDLTASRLASLNHGSIRSPLPGGEANTVLSKVRTWAQLVPEIHVDGETRDAIIRVQVAEVDYESIIDKAKASDSDQRQRNLVTELVLAELGLGHLAPDALGTYRDKVIWRGTGRTVEVLFGNVRDTDWLYDDHFKPAETDAWRLIIDHPFDLVGHSPGEDQQRLDRLVSRGQTAQTLVWVPHFLAEEKHRELRRLVVLDWVLARDDRWDDHSNHLAENDRAQARAMLMTQRDGLRNTVIQNLRQAYGITGTQPGVLLEGGRSPQLLVSLDPALDPGEPEGVGFKTAYRNAVDKAFSATWPGHPQFEPEDHEVGLGELRAVLAHLQRALEDPDRRVTLEGDRGAVRRVANALEVGHAAETHFLFGDGHFGSWGTELTRGLGVLGRDEGSAPVTVGELQHVIRALTPARGLTRPMEDLVIHAWALLRQRAWHHHGSAVPAPALGAAHPSMELRPQKLPSREDWGTAVDRAGRIFGVSGNPHLTPQSMNELAEGVRSAAREGLPAAKGLVTALRKLGEELKLGGDFPRLASAVAVEELARQLAAEQGLALVNALAGAELDQTEQVLGTSFASAVAVTAAIDSVQWKLVQAGMKGIAQPALRAIIEPLIRAAKAEEFADKLQPALKVAGDQLLEWLTRVPTPVTPPTPPTPPTPDTPDDQRPDHTFVVRGRHGRSKLQKLVDHMESHPDDEFQVWWRIT
ncbi:DUF6079 family protein [Granulicoccus sp. GXG6511]|uniref:DUF6079 family protein n=1 Tax=Granulicoccus sp. GXG6511 TaxID=3381351 RepID=UPI003D7E8CF0